MKIINKNIVAAIMLLASATSCTDILDQNPQASVTEAAYFKTVAEIKAGADNLHTNVYAWNGNTTYAINFDNGSDMSSAPTADGSGTNTATTTDEYWDKAYAWLRTVNVFLSKTDAYPNKDEIAGYTGQAYFFRAWHHFFLLKRFGGVPIATEVTDPSSEIVFGPRASRYQVMAQIMKDLDAAIENLTKGAVTKASTANDGHVTVEAAKALKARIALYEGTWEKYVKTATDGDGTSAGAGSAGYDANKYKEYLTIAKTLSKELIDGGQFSLWKGMESVTAGGVANPEMYAHTSYYYLFNLEDAGSNPNGLTKASNHEAIFRSVYDFNLRRGGTNLTHSKPAKPSRKYMDMALCTDGLPVQHSPLFQGYKTMTSEYENRDYRLTSTIQKPMDWYWGWGSNNAGSNYAIDITTLASTTYQYIPNLNGSWGYNSRKFGTESNDRVTNQESADYLHIRMAEIYLIYAEATAELGNGEISDADLNYSINVVRDRAGVAPLTHALIAPYSDLTLLGEIRRERAIELHGEGQRITDLCRWGIAQDEMAGQPICGIYIKYNGEETEYSTAINPNTGNPILNKASYGEANILQSEITVSTYPGIATTKPGAIISELASNRRFAIKNYLQPISTTQINLNPNLVQNPGW
ncbi:putative outer membrane starch-binding protein [Dyadobacter jejuensis]|uniref:Putative outer membrane starch-binding protein n=1 Tax=Dyadobacter jejuensis TaxID=1082580 RepID=A0A316ALK2_9BACT|nr:RagB/SusD family nutrient uptake outer membrane protein [Dyadobacter jejuensis]PWJ57934.1 putative outer membrane starch-binding protein [Dyadobacter jejuensis]